MHLDHAGGLDAFAHRKDVEIWVHDRELRSALWSAATGADVGVYMSHYMNLDWTWKTFDDRTVDFCQGITLHHLPGHTDGITCLSKTVIQASANGDCQALSECR